MSIKQQCQFKYHFKLHLSYFLSFFFLFSRETPPSYKGICLASRPQVPSEVLSKWGAKQIWRRMPPTQGREMDVGADTVPCQVAVNSERQVLENNPHVGLQRYTCDLDIATLHT